MNIRKKKLTIIFLVWCVTALAILNYSESFEMLREYTFSNITSGYSVPLSYLNLFIIFLTTITTFILGIGAILESQSTSKKVILPSSEVDDYKKKLNRHKELLFYISDSVHNIGTEMYNMNKKPIDEDKLKQKLGSFFAYTRTLSLNIDRGYYSDEHFEEILGFIKHDFHDFCHYIKNDMNTDKYWELIEEKGSSNV